MALSAAATAAMIGAASTLAGQGANMAYSAGKTKKQRRFQVQMANMEWRRKQEMWHMQNEYNSPAAQMERYKAAGLNPNLIYDKGTPGNATTMPSYQQPKGEFDVPRLQMPDLVGLYQSFQQREAQIEQTKAQTDNIRKEGLLRDVEIFLSGFRKKLGESQYMYDKDALEQNRKLLPTLYDKTLSESGLKKYEFQWAQERFNRYKSSDGVVDINRDPVLAKFMYWILGKMGQLGKDYIKMKDGRAVIQDGQGNIITK